MKKNLFIARPYVLFVLLLTSLMIFSACASKPKFEGNAELCGLIIDENNSPVKDFVVYCKSDSNPLLSISPVITNDGGMFVFFNLPSGRYKISGEKTNYLKILKIPYNFNDRSKILCLQTKTFKAALSNAEELIRLGERKSAAEILDSICCEKKTEEKKLISAYKVFTLEEGKKKDRAIKKLKEVNK